MSWIHVAAFLVGGAVIVVGSALGFGAAAIPAGMTIIGAAAGHAQGARPSKDK